MSNPKRPTMSLVERRQTKHQMVTLEDWLRGIRHVRNPLDLTVFLLSSPKDWEFKNKVQVLLLLPKKAIRDDTGMKLLETRLEDAGQPGLARVVRWLCFQNLPWRFRMSNRIWCYMKLTNEGGFGEMVQRSAFIKEELRTLQASLELLGTDTNNNTKQAIDTHNQINRYKAELQWVEECYQEMDAVLGAWNESYLLGCLEEHLEHLGRTQTGTSVHRCVRDAREEVVAVDGPADAVKKTVSSPFGQEIEGTVLIHVVVVFALMANNTKDFLKRNLGQRKPWGLGSAYVSASAPGRPTWIASVVCISGEWASLMSLDCSDH